jgi:hypothetical protein
MESFPQLIAAAMRTEWGATPSARKEVGRITRANERAVRNWFDGRNGPSGENLVSLIRHSDAVFEAVLIIADRRTALGAVRVVALRQKLQTLIDFLDETPSP